MAPEDAARLKVYEKSWTFPKVTKAAGLASLKIVVEEDAVFPATKSELIEKQGWKVFDLTENEHVHADMLLGKLEIFKCGRSHRRFTIACRSKIRILIHSSKREKGILRRGTAIAC